MRCDDCIVGESVLFGAGTASGTDGAGRRRDRLRLVLYDGV